jgi:hypothetical protein
MSEHKARPELAGRESGPTVPVGQGLSPPINQIERLEGWTQ